jgi:hypothetical protein
MIEMDKQGIAKPLGSVVSNEAPLGTWGVSEFGYYGKFGGAYIPEMLHPNVEQLKTRYLEIMAEASFQKEYLRVAKRLCR